MNEEMKTQLIQQAELAHTKAYAPYSNFPVGAAILTKTGEVFIGCNVENISFGLTSCAERNAIFTAISQLGKIEIVAVAVATESQDGASPCGACRQVIAEFGPTAQIYYKHKGKYYHGIASDLLPSTFDQLA